ncbi:MAG: Polar-differentiation response regulator DivK [Alphaproteobacteria bacterium MarineAlpha3_Bin5]|nr:two-component system response regulator [Magnetovibrio sp.]PPR79645.1 MAG: Polar-differentiation response regulator DivK [Alphaproteobacteria bacterium MarineAlpha3_Bin5]
MAKTILIIEDNELTMKLVTDLLQVHGYIVLQSVDGSDLDELVLGKDLDLILMDIRLKGLSGVDILRELKANQKFNEVPVIAVTAYAMSGDEEKILNHGFDSYIAKPTSIETLLTTIRRYIG